MLEQETIKLALDFFKSWEKGTFADLVASYRHYLDPNVVYENAGVPTCNGIDESIKLIESVCLVPKMDIQTIRVEIKEIAAVGDVVFSERIDWHYNSKGEATLVPEICGVMKFKDGKIVRWSDYYDPTPMKAAFS
jgi:limonene-1,2-epoxide hydrolase